MNNLNSTIKTAIKVKTITSFENLHPQVAGWFKGNYFQDIMVVGLGSVRLRATYKGDNFTQQPCEGLPFQDDVGEVDLGDIEGYLTAQGFDACVDVGYPMDCTYLIIKVKED